MLRLLWIDDDARSCWQTGRVLQAHGAQVEIVPDICEAVAKLLSGSFDFVLIDVGITVGDLEQRFPDIARLMPSEPRAVGLDFARVLMREGHQLSRAHSSIAICSGYEAPYLNTVSPEVMSAVAYVSKKRQSFAPYGFVADICRTIGLEYDYDPLTEQADDQLLNLEYVDLYHDLKARISPCIPTLRHVVERISALADGGAPTVEAAAAAIERFGVEVIEDVSVLPGFANVGRLGAAEDVLDRIIEMRRHLSAADHHDLARLVDRLLLKVALLPNVGSSARLASACRQLHIRLCEADIEQVSARLLDGLSKERPDNADEGMAGFDSSALLHQIIKLEEPHALDNRVGFELDIAPQIVIKGRSQAKLRQAFFNVVNNAVKYSGRLPSGNTWVKVRHFARQGQCVTEVENWGPPISESEKQVIFGAGIRGEKPFRTGEGRGLAIARSCVEEMRGTIGVKSKKDRQKAITTFTISIPVE